MKISIDTLKQAFGISLVLSLVLSQTSQEWFFLTATISHLLGVLMLCERIKGSTARRVCYVLLLGLAPFTIGAINGASEGIASVLHGGTKDFLYGYQRIGEEVYRMPGVIKEVLEARDARPLARNLALPILLLGFAGIPSLVILLLFNIPQEIILSLKERRESS